MFIDKLVVVQGILPSYEVALNLIELTLPLIFELLTLMQSFLSVALSAPVLCLIVLSNWGEPSIATKFYKAYRSTCQSLPSGTMIDLMLFPKVSRPSPLVVEL